MNKFDLKYKIKRISDLLIYIGKQIGPKIAPVHEIPYSTHIPVLIGLSSHFDFVNVLELGTGNYSTKLFLNKSIFPHLKKLDSYENELEWAKMIKKENEQDPRFNLFYNNRPICENLVDVNIVDYDLIFIDDSQNAYDRVNTILKVLHNPEKVKLLVIHDFENRHYRKATKKICHYFTFSNFTPCTGVLWHNQSNELIMKKIFEVIEKNKDFIDTQNIEGWIHEFKFIERSSLNY